PAGGRQRGLGLGLALVRSLADILGHRVGVRSAEGNGSMFFVEVPISEKPAASVPPPARPLPLPVEAPAVLIIEDDPAVRDSLELVLARGGYDVTAVASGEDGVALVEGGRLLPAMVIADHTLPGVLSGVDAAQRIRGRRDKTAGLIL